MIVVTATAYFLAAPPAVLLNLGDLGMASLVWPASGVGLAALLILGLRVWPGITLGSYAAASVMFDRPLLAALGLAAGSTIGALVAYLLLRRAGFDNDLARVRDALALVVCGAVAGMATGAAIRSGVQVLAGIQSADEYWPLVLRSWIGTGLGILVVTPSLLVLRKISLRRAVDKQRLVEVVGLFVVTLAVTAWVLLRRSGGEELFLVFPLLIWAAWRFQLEGATPCVLAVSVLTVLATVWGVGPFDGADPQAALFTSQTFVAATTLATLFLAVSVTERNEARQEIEQAARELARAVRTLDDRMRADDGAGVRSPEAASQFPLHRVQIRIRSADRDNTTCRTERVPRPPDR